MKLLLVAALATTAVASPASTAKLSPGARTTVQNALWKEDAWPTSPSLAPGGRLSIAYFNSSRGGRVTLLHLVLTGADARETLLRHVALSITYDDLSHPSVFVPAGDFFVEHGGQSGNASFQSGSFETPFLAFRPSRSWYSYFHMPYRRSIRIELVGAAELHGPVGCESWVQHSDVPWQEDDGYFHAHFAFQPRLKFPWQPAIFAPTDGWRGPGQLVGLAMRFSAPPQLASAFGGTMTHVCEGNWELYLDNTTALRGNDSRTDVAAAGYQASEHAVVVTGSEDMFGYSFGWASQTTGALSGTPLWVNHEPGAGVQLSTYRFFDNAPMQFTTSLHAQVNWAYDTGGAGKNVPADLCPAGGGCEVEYDVLSYLYLARPADATAEVSQLPWVAA